MTLRSYGPFHRQWHKAINFYWLYGYAALNSLLNESLEEATGILRQKFCCWRHSSSPSASTRLLCRPTAAPNVSTLQGRNECQCLEFSLTGVLIGDCQCVFLFWTSAVLKYVRIITSEYVFLIHSWGKYYTIVSIKNQQKKVVSRQHLTKEARFRYWFCSREICGWKFDTEKGFPPSTYNFPCEFDFDNAPYSS